METKAINPKSADLDDSEIETVNGGLLDDDFTVVELASQGKNYKGGNEAIFSGPTIKRPTE